MNDQQPSTVKRDDIAGDGLACVISRYLDLMDFQRETTFAALAGITDLQLWQRPASNEWTIGEILNHNCLLTASFYPVMLGVWKLGNWYGRIRRNCPYQTEIDDLYRRSSFPQWVGFLWTPRYNRRKSVSLEVLKSETEIIHTKVRRFYDNKAEDILGNLYLYDPVFGWCNLIVTLRICVYHDQLHYDDVFKQVKLFKL